MNGVNKVIILGRLTREPEVKYGANGNAIANLSVATSEKWKDKQTGEMQEKSEFHRVVIFGKLADVAGQYLTKGSQVYLEGKLQTRKWQDTNTGQDRYSTEILIDVSGKMQMLGGGQNQGQNNAQSQNQQGQNTGQNNGQYQGGGQGYAPTNTGQQPQYQNQRAVQEMQRQAPPNFAPDDFKDDNVPF